MKSTHRPDVFCWSSFDAARNIDFHGYAWTRPGGNVLIDPMPMSEHDLAHLQALGGAAWIVITNSDHTRGATQLAARFGARVAGPAAEREGFPLACARWLDDGEEVVPGLRVLRMEGSKTPGELALLLEGGTLFCGDMVRAHVAGKLNLLPDAKLADKGQALASLGRLAALDGVDAVLVGDGWPVFRDGARALRELRASLD